MWSPTHVQVTVCRVRGLLTKGKNGTNDAFVTISLGKEKFQTSVKQKAASDLEWQEECELAIPTQGNTAEIVLTALHQNFIGVDEFLGMVALPLSHFDVYERPRTKWYPLKSKPGQEGKNKLRGEIEVRVAFTVKSGSLLDLSKKEKHKGSFGHVTQAAHNIGGSLMSLGKEKKGGIKKLASSVGSKLRLPKSGARDDKGDDRLSRHSSGRYSGKYSSGEPDPGVISEDDDEFRFDELSHKSSGSSLNLAGGSSLASGQGSLENLGGGELLRHNSMKRSGSSATLPNRAIQSSTSSSSIGLSAGNSASKLQSQQQDWNQKLFGNKQSKVSEAPVGFKQQETTAAVTPAATTTATKTTSSLVVGGVPSIIIQDSFIVERPSRSPSSSPPPSKLNGNNAPVPKARTINKSPEMAADVPRQRKEVLPIVEPVEVKTQSTGEEAEGGQSLSARTRMSSSPPPLSSFPVGVEQFSRSPPVPKPRRSPLPSSGMAPPANPFDSDSDSPIKEPPVKAIQLNPFESDSEVVPELNPFECDDSEIVSPTKEKKPTELNPFDCDNSEIVSPTKKPAELNPFEEDDQEHNNLAAIKPNFIQLNPFDDDSDSEPVTSPVPKVTNVTYTAIEEPVNVLVLHNVGDELDEDGVCQMLEKAIEEHEAPSQEDLLESEATVDFFNDQTIEISPVAKVGSVTCAPLHNVSGSDETPSDAKRRDRLFSLFSTPNSETDAEQQAEGLVHLDWQDDSQENSSQGFGGSDQLSIAMTVASGSDGAKTMDSAVSVTDLSTSNWTPSASLMEVQNRPLACILPPQMDVNFTPPPASASSVQSNKADLSWDNYDMRMIPSTPGGGGGAAAGQRRSIVAEPPADEDAKARRKRISLAPSLKMLTLDSPVTGELGSPITEDDDEQAAPVTPTANTNETHRMKMAASFHQRVVVGEDKPANNNTSRDHHRTPRDTSTSEDRLRVYQEKSREGLISLLEERDNEISDLKDYIDKLLLRVIDTCPTVLQTPVKAKQSSRK